jgi:hypothetical protein
MTDSPPVYRVTIRLSPEVYAQLEAQGSTGKPLAAIVRDALLDYLARQPQPPQQPPTVEETGPLVTAMTARRQPELPAAATSRQSRQPRQPTHRTGRPGIPQETLQAIAAARQQHPDLSLRQLAQYLFEAGIYASRTRDGRRVPVGHSRLQRWLQRAEDEGLP